jgi:hypothetical protein
VVAGAVVVLAAVVGLDHAVGTVWGDPQVVIVAVHGGDGGEALSRSMKLQDQLQRLLLFRDWNQPSLDDAISKWGNANVGL